MTENEQRSQDHVMSVLARTAKKHPAVPEELVDKIMRHESAVQFDEKRYEASNYIRSLIFEHLDSGS